MSQPLLEFKNLTISFGSSKPVVQNVNLKLNSGTTLALVGESGSGKSLTALSSALLLPPNAQFKGEIYFQNRVINAFSDKELQQLRGNNMSYIFQEPMTSLNPVHTVFNQVHESLILHNKLSKKEAKMQTCEILQQVGLTERLANINGYPHQLSGGQRQRAMIAMALINKPKLLIADEPTTALDVTVEKQILDLLEKLKKVLSLTILFITHDLSIVKKIAAEIAVMKEGRIVEYGKTDEILSNPQKEYTRQLINADAVRNPTKLKKESQEIFRAEHISVRYSNKFNILKLKKSYFNAVNNVSFSIKAGETVGVIGESGCGKTSLGLAALRLLNFSGHTFLQGKSIRSSSKSELKNLRRQMQIVFQDPYGSLSPRLTVEEIIKEGLSIHQKNLSKNQTNNAICKVLHEVGLSPNIIGRYPHEFSGGQRQRIALARALILKPKFLVLDEPTSALDRTIQVQIIDILRFLQTEYKISYLFISHDLRIIRSLSHQLIIMKNGSVVEQGSADSIFKNPQHSYTRSLFSNIV